MKIQKPLLLTIASIIQMGSLYAQKPTDVPKPGEKPIDLTNPADLIIYIVLPICIIILYFIWDRNRKNDRK